LVKYLDKKDNNFPNKKFDIILSPAFYWIKKIEINLPEYKLRKMASSFFDGELPDGDYEYFVKNGFVIAYDKKMIKEYLLANGVNISNVNKLYFAQFELKNILPTIDEIVLCMPSQTVDISEIKKLSKYYTYFNSISLDSRELNIILISTIVFTIINIGNLGFLKFKNSEVLSQIENINSEYNLPATSYQLEAELSKYKEIFNTQLELRKKLYKITRQNRRVNRITINKKKIDVEYK